MDIVTDAIESVYYNRILFAFDNECGYRGLKDKSSQGYEHKQKNIKKFGYKCTFTGAQGFNTYKQALQTGDLHSHGGTKHAYTYW